MFSSRFTQISSRILAPHTNIHHQQKCFLHLHEYQSQKILEKFGVNVSLGDVATTPEEARGIAERMGIYFTVVLTSNTIKVLTTLLSF